MCFKREESFPRGDLQGTWRIVEMTLHINSTCSRPRPTGRAMAEAEDWYEWHEGSRLPLIACLADEVEDGRDEADDKERHGGLRSDRDLEEGEVYSLSSR